MASRRLAAAAALLLAAALPRRACAFATAAARLPARPPTRRAAGGALETLVRDMHGSADPLFDLIKHEARAASLGDSQIAHSMHSTVLSHTSLHDAVAELVAHKLETPFVAATQWRHLLHEMCDRGQCAPVSEDIIAAAMRDRSALNALAILLYSKGFHALVTHRLAHWLWQAGRTELALHLQSLNSQVFGADIHPGARLGRGIYLASATGVVIGETATVGDNCSIEHYVTLGGTGKDAGDRHPKVGSGVRLGVGCAVLGNVKVGDGSIVEPGAVLLADVDAYVRASGVPAKAISRLRYVRRDSDKCVLRPGGGPVESPDSWVCWFGDGVGT